MPEDSAPSERLSKFIKLNLICGMALLMAVSLILPVWPCRHCRGSGLVHKAQDSCASCGEAGVVGISVFVKQLFH
jgi:hypothetical protein